MDVFLQSSLDCLVHLESGLDFSLLFGESFLVSVLEGFLLFLKFINLAKFLFDGTLKLVNVVLQFLAVILPFGLIVASLGQVVSCFLGQVLLLVVEGMLEHGDLLGKSANLLIFLQDLCSSLLEHLIANAL